MSLADQLRQRIEWLEATLVECRDREQRERLIERLLDTQDQLMTVNINAARQTGSRAQGGVMICECVKNFRPFIGIRTSGANPTPGNPTIAAVVRTNRL